MSQSLFSRWRRDDHGVYPAPAPERPFIAVGDIHGRLDLLDKLHDVVTDVPRDWPAVFVGDYIDRGDNSAGVLARLCAPRSAFVRDVVFLRGNHEDMLLSFLDRPEEAGPRWLRHGGMQTLASFGLDLSTAPRTPEDYGKVRDGLIAALGTERIAWLNGCPPRWSSGAVHVVHAGADPRTAVEAQSAQTMIWGHPDFASARRADGAWIVHGHTIVEAPAAVEGRIPIDTGAFATGRLTAALIQPDGKVEFRQTQA